MPGLSRLTLLLLCLAPGVPAGQATVADLHWMSGCWASTGADPGSGEFWLPPAGDAMLGISRTVSRGRTVAWEYMRIAVNDDGVIEYVASPSGQATAAFALVHVTDSEVVFENRRHDFPQRIIYRRLSNDGLLGRIEGEKDGKSRSADFPMSRAACSNEPN